MLPLVVLSGCVGVAGQGVNPAGGQAVIQASPATVNFGNVTVGTKSSLPVTLSNTGGSDLTISVLTLSGASFSVSGIAAPKTISAGQSATMNVTYAPSSAGSNSGSIVITSNDSKSPATIALSGTATTASVGQLTLSPASLNFGNVNVGGSSTLTSTLTNSGQAAANISQVNVTGTGFTVSGLTVPATLNPGNSVTLQVKYAPGSAGAASGSVSIISDAQGSPTTLALSGTGLQPGLSLLPASISFGNVVVGMINSQTVKITNSGNASLTISQATLTGSGFSTSGLTTPLTLAAGQASTFTVLFAPAAAGSVSGSLALTSNAPNSPASIPLSGSGVAATYTLSVSPTSLSFGNVNTGSSASQSVSIANTGNSNVTISQISVSGAGFSATGVGVPVTLSPSQKVTLTIQFSPSVAGSVSGTISVVSNASGSPAVISASGTGVTPTVAHSVALTWNASSSTISGYNVYRSTVSGSSYAKVSSTLVTGLTYTDGTVQSALTYYYVTTAVDASGNESAYSNEAQAVIP
ncbi:MAG: choice-of-anchor D domain-containing protein [Acidobacteriia bacterium]|nr:choice-of-anchor D domain-containing protein [Terriglobia bacterium]